MAALLKGTAFITGAASGIGQHTALSFAKYGIQRFALADVNADALNSSIKSLQEAYPQVEVLALRMDVRNSVEVKSGIAETVQRFGRIDVAVNNAGIAGSGMATHEIEEEDFMRVVDVNLHGVWRCQKEQIAVMMKQDDLGPREGRGRIINVASIYGIIAPGTYMHQTAYATAKHGVLGLTQGDGNTYGPHGIRINAICPGYVETPLLMTGIKHDSSLGQAITKSPLGRLATPEEVSDAITLLASPLSSFMQSAALIVDGGFSVV